MAKKFEKIFVIHLTRASCSVLATEFLSKIRRRFLKINVDKSYYTNFKKNGRNKNPQLFILRCRKVKNTYDSDFGNFVENGTKLKILSTNLLRLSHLSSPERSLYADCASERNYAYHLRCLLGP